MANSFQTPHEDPEFEGVAELAESIVYRLRDCPDLVVRKTIREVAREFCRETKCLTSELRLELMPGVARYPVPPLYNGVVDEVREVRINRSRLLRRDIDYRVVNGETPIIVLISGRASVESRAPERGGVDPRVYRPAQNVMNGPRFPEAFPGCRGADPRDFLFVKAVEIPRLDSENLPGFFVQKYGDAIVCGVLARLYAQKAKPWTDEYQAPEMRQCFENLKSELRMRAETPPGGRFIDTSMVL